MNNIIRNWIYIVILLVAVFYLWVLIPVVMAIILVIGICIALVFIGLFIYAIYNEHKTRK